MYAQRLPGSTICHETATWESNVATTREQRAFDFEIEKVDLKPLPARWHETRDESSRCFGDEWINGGRTVALLVPSAAIREEWNVLLNPAHAEFSKIKSQKPEPFKFDVRMFR
jgi:RES domain-containing protein